jgi:hypothetical protein
MCCMNTYLLAYFPESVRILKFNTLAGNKILFTQLVHAFLRETILKV